MSAVVAVTVMHVLLFVLHVCEGDGNAGVGSGGGVFVVSVCMSGTRGSGVLSSTGDMLVRGVGGVCDMCMCLARGGVGGEGRVSCVCVWLGAVWVERGG